MSEKREYEMFCDECYYDMRCVRDISDKKFSSRTSRHLNTKQEAEQLLELLNKAK